MDEKIPTLSPKKEEATRAPRYLDSAVDRMNDAPAAARESFMQRLRRYAARVKAAVEAIIAWWRARLPPRSELAKAGADQVLILVALVRREALPPLQATLSAHAALSVWIVCGAEAVSRLLSAVLFGAGYAPLLSLVVWTIAATALVLAGIDRVRIDSAPRARLFASSATALSSLGFAVISGPAWSTPAAPLVALFAVASIWILALSVLRFGRETEHTYAALVFPSAIGATAIVLTVLFLRESTPAVVEEEPEALPSVVVEKKPAPAVVTASEPEPALEAVTPAAAPAKPVKAKAKKKHGKRH